MLSPCRPQTLMLSRRLKKSSLVDTKRRFYIFVSIQILSCWADTELRLSVIRNRNVVTISPCRPRVKISYLAGSKVSVLILSVNFLSLWLIRSKTCEHRTQFHISQVKKLLLGWPKKLIAMSYLARKSAPAVLTHNVDFISSYLKNCDVKQDLILRTSNSR